MESYRGCAWGRAQTILLRKVATVISDDEVISPVSTGCGFANAHSRCAESSPSNSALITIASIQSKDSSKTWVATSLLLVALIIACCDRLWTEPWIDGWDHETSKQSTGDQSTDHNCRQWPLHFGSVTRDKAIGKKPKLATMAVISTGLSRLSAVR